MHGIVSLLHEPHYSKVEQLWHELEQECGLSGIRVTPIPHFSWQVAQEYDLDRLRPVLRDIAALAKPFLVHTTGVGMFSGPKPVVFINLIKNAEMLRFHELVWERTKNTAMSISPFYAPPSWMPHITLAHGDLVWPTMSCAIQKLAFQAFNWDILVDNIAVISQDKGQVGKESLHFMFLG